MSRRRAIHREPRTIAAVMACVSALLIGIAFWPAMNRAHAGQRSHSGDNLDYASPLELLLSPDGARLYVLCQQSEEIRVLDATTYAADQDHRRGARTARHGALFFRRSPVCDELLG